MITRMWRGWTSADDADAYEAFLREELFPSMREIDGFLGGEVLRRPDGGDVAFVTLTRFTSLDAIRAFAGADYERAVLEPRARDLLSRHDHAAVHYETPRTGTVVHCDTPPMGTTGIARLPVVHYDTPPTGTIGIARLPAQRDVIAPDGSDVRILLGGSRGGMAHFQLGPGETSVAVRHRTIEELWYFVAGRGQMWRRSAQGEDRVDDVEAGVSIDIPCGTTFQFRALGGEPLSAIGATMPPWPGSGEAILADGPWEPTVDPGPA